MNRTSKWVEWYRVLAVIGCIVLAVVSIKNGWEMSSYPKYSYSYGYQEGHNMSIFFKYAGIGCGIAVVLWLISMMVCEFLDNVSMIAHKLSDWNYTTATRDFIEELANNPKTREKTKEIYNNMIKSKEQTE